MKYKPNSLESEIVKSIHNSLSGNGCYPQFQARKIDDGDVDAITGEIEFNYQLDKVYQDGKSIKIKPKAFNILITVDVFPTEG